MVIAHSQALPTKLFRQSSDYSIAVAFRIGVFLFRSLTKAVRWLARLVVDLLKIKPHLKKVQTNLF